MKEILGVKKREIIIILIIVISCVLYMFFMKNQNKNSADKVIIKVDGKIENVNRLDKDNIIKYIKDDKVNIIEIKNGEVKMIDASCPDKLCVKHRKIKYNEENIICLPHHLIVEIKSDKESDIDILR